MLHRIVSRSVVVLAATAFLASCEDNTTGTPLTPPPASTAVYVNAITPDSGYGVKDTTITIPELAGVPAHDTVVTIASPNPEFEVVTPEGDAATGQVITFNLNLPGLLQQTKDTVPESGLVSPGYWVLGDRAVQRVIASPVSGSTGFIDVDTTPPAPPEE